MSCDAWVKNSAQQITNEEKLMSDGGCETAIGFRRFATGDWWLPSMDQWRAARVVFGQVPPRHRSYLPFL